MLSTLRTPFKDIIIPTDVQRQIVPRPKRRYAKFRVRVRYLVEWWMASEVLRSEVQVIRTQSTATNASMDTISGNFRLSWGEDGEETDYLPADVGEVELEAALEGLQDIRDVQVKREGAHHGCIKRITNKSIRHGVRTTVNRSQLTYLLRFIRVSM